MIISSSHTSSISYFIIFNLLSYMYNTCLQEQLEYKHIYVFYIFINAAETICLWNISLCSKAKKCYDISVSFHCQMVFILVDRR